MKKFMCNKYFVSILVVVVVFCFAGYKIVEYEYMKKECHNYIAKTIMAGDLYSNEKSDSNRDKLIKALQDLVVIYAEIRDREKGDKSYNAKLICDFLSSSYDILEVNKNQVNHLSDLLDALHMLEEDIFDETGIANDYILSFIKAN